MGSKMRALDRMKGEPVASTEMTDEADDEDKIVQKSIVDLLDESPIDVDETDLKSQLEKIVIILLGIALKSGSLTFAKYNQLKKEYREEMMEHIRRNEVEDYDFTTDVFARLDVVIMGYEKKPGRGDKKKHSLTKDMDTVVCHQVGNLLQKTKLSTGDKDIQHQLELIIKIQLGRMLATGNLTFERYNIMKVEYRDNIHRRLHRGEIQSYNFDSDIFSQLDLAIRARN